VYSLATLTTKSYVYDRETGLAHKGNEDLETARQAAEERLQGSDEDGILELAQRNAETYLADSSPRSVTRRRSSETAPAD
jgi:hypothetical protein